MSASPVFPDNHNVISKFKILEHESADGYAWLILDENNFPYFAILKQDTLVYTDFNFLSDKIDEYIKIADETINQIALYKSHLDTYVTTDIQLDHEQSNQS